MENFVKDHFLPTMFVDYRKRVQQAISSKFLPYASSFSFIFFFTSHFIYLLLFSFWRLTD